MERSPGGAHMHSSWHRQTQGLEALPDKAGGYVLVMRQDQEKVLSIGALGRARFPTGIYAYVGSARGPGGIKARVLRHASTRDDKRPHWHIDFLRAQCEIIQVWWHQRGNENECDLAAALALEGLRRPKGFGASDCRCGGHLVQFDTERQLEAAANRLSLPGRLSLPSRDSTNWTRNERA
jgi:Uri superfamily endonuclease